MTALPSRLFIAHSAISRISGIPKLTRVERRCSTAGLINENRQLFVSSLVMLVNIKFWNTVVISLLIRLCMTFRVERSRTIQAVLAVQFWNGTQLQLIFVSAAMSIRSLDNEHFLFNMTSYFPRNPFRTISCVKSLYWTCVSVVNFGLAGNVDFY